MSKILISIKDPDEAAEVIAAGGVDVLDIKNPSEGTLGANTPWVIEEIKGLAKGMEIAASIGDLDYKPGTASLAAYGVAKLGMDYVTASMYAVKTKEQVVDMALKLSRAIDDFDCELIVSGYADYKRVGCANPFEYVGELDRADLVMIDTAIKDGTNILDFASAENLSDFIERAREMGLKSIIAGSMRYPQLPVVAGLKPNFLGFRGIVCEGGVVKKELVSRLKEELNKL